MHRHLPHRPPPRPSSGTGRRVVWVLAVAGLAALAVTALVPTQRRVAAPPRPQPMSRMSPRHLQEHAALNGVVGGATAGQRELATVPVSTGAGEPGMTGRPPLPHLDAGAGRAAVRLERVKSDAPHTSRERAVADALQVAEGKLADRLRALDPPVHAVPSAADIEARYLKKGSVTEIQPPADVKQELADKGIDPNRVWVELDVEVSADQLRELRAADRRTDAGLAAGLLFAAALAGCLFLRLDAWTKGYLTGTLGVVAVLLVGAAAVVAVRFLRGG